ncbi:hypothetical protein [Ancrocorticia populi]
MSVDPEVVRITAAAELAQVE